jgi:hypothetical protein
MRFAVMFALVGSALWAQQRNVTSPTGFGRILFPGGTPPAGGSPFGRIIYPGTGAPAATRNMQGNPAPPASHPGHSGVSVIPYPVLFGNYLQYDPPQAPLASSTSPQTDAPVVIVNQYFRPDAPPPVQAAPPASRVVEETQAAPAIAEKEAPFFLIAMQDHTIYAASAYWVEENTLNYITIQGSQNSASLDLVDRALSARLNRERKVAFGLPGN